MTKLRVHCLSISLDGYGAGHNQDINNPLGVGGLALHNWMISTRTFQDLEGNGVGESGVDDEFVARGFAKCLPVIPQLGSCAATLQRT
jgi:hypothetical protein